MPACFVKVWKRAGEIVCVFVLGKSPSNGDVWEKRRETLVLAHSVVARDTVQTNGLCKWCHFLRTATPVSETDFFLVP
jgi:hypothetical protein